MPKLDALKAASLHGAAALGMEHRIGTIEPGKLANIVFLGEDPLAGAESLRSVQLTVKRGTSYYRGDFVLGGRRGNRRGGRRSREDRRTRGNQRNRGDRRDE